MEGCPFRWDTDMGMVSCLQAIEVVVAVFAAAIVRAVVIVAEVDCRRTPGSSVAEVYRPLDMLLDVPLVLEHMRNLD